MRKWKVYKLGDFANINPKVALKMGDEYSFVEMKDLNPTLKYASPSTIKDLKGGSKFENYDTLFARITPCLENGKICQVKSLQGGVGFGSTEFLIFRGKDKISDTDFVYYLVRTDYVRNSAIQMMTGTSGRQRVEKSALEKLQVNVPEDLLTQRVIASILSSLDNKIELNLQINQTLELMAQAIFKEWFVNFNFPGFNGKLNNGLPEGWRIGKLGEVMELLYGKALKADIRISGIYPVIGSSGVVDYHNQFLVEAPGIVIGRKGTIGEVIWLDEHFFPIDTTFYVKDILGVDGLYFHYFLLKEQNFKKIASDSAVPGLNRNQAMDNVVVIPDSSVIVQFNSIAKSIFEKKALNTSQVKALTQIRDTLLPKLISGEIEIKI